MQRIPTSEVDADMGEMGEKNRLRPADDGLTQRSSI